MKTKFLQYFISSIVLAAVIGVSLVVKISFMNEKESIFVFVMDSFFLGGLLYIGISLFTLVGKYGMFDAISYSFVTMKYLFTPKKSDLDKRITYKEYLDHKKEKGRKWYPFFLYIGLVCIGISTILYVIYFLLK